MNYCKMKVSVIIPNFNHASYLHDRINSVLSQTFKDFEIIILDDKSSDNSKDVINLYKNNPFVSHIIYNDENSGSPFIQWQKGFKMAKGEYIWIAESDDTCELSMLSELVKALDNHNKCSFAYCLSNFIDIRGDKLGHSYPSGDNKYIKSEIFNANYMCCETPIYNVSSALIRKNAIEHIPNDYINYKGAGDKLFWVLLAQIGDVFIINKHLNNYRIQGNKVTSKKSKDGTNLKELKRIFDYMVNNHMLSSAKQYLTIGYHNYLIQSSVFENDVIKNNLLDLWGRCGLFQMTIGRLYVSLRYHLNLFL